MTYNQSYNSKENPKDVLTSDIEEFKETVAQHKLLGFVLYAQVEDDNGNSYSIMHSMAQDPLETLENLCGTFVQGIGEQDDE